jgi:hypothetical protein
MNFWHRGRGIRDILGCVLRQDLTQYQTSNCMKSRLFSLWLVLSLHRLQNPTQNKKSLKSFGLRLLAFVAGAGLNSNHFLGDLQQLAAL